MGWGKGDGMERFGMVWKRRILGGWGPGGWMDDANERERKISAGVGGENGV